MRRRRCSIADANCDGAELTRGVMLLALASCHEVALSLQPLHGGRITPSSFFVVVVVAFDIKVVNVAQQPLTVEIMKPQWRNCRAPIQLPLIRQQSSAIRWSFQRK